MTRVRSGVLAVGVILLAGCGTTRMRAWQPGGEDMAFSSAGVRYVLHNVDADTEEDVARLGDNHVLYLQRGETSIPLLIYGRNCRACVSPRARYVAITDYDGSDHAGVYVYDVVQDASIEIEPLVHQRFGATHGVLQSDHLYFEGRGWPNAHMLLIEVSGWINPAGDHERWYTYDALDHTVRESRSRPSR